MENFSINDIKQVFETSDSSVANMYLGKGWILLGVGFCKDSEDSYSMYQLGNTSGDAPLLDTWEGYPKLQDIVDREALNNE